jgi:hypothetical protein
MWAINPIFLVRASRFSPAISLLNISAKTYLGNIKEIFEKSQPFQLTCQLTWTHLLSAVFLPNLQEKIPVGAAKAERLGFGL